MYTKFIIFQEEKMMALKKFAAILITAITAVTMCIVPVSADSIFDTAKEITSGKSYKITLEDEGDVSDYKVEVSDKGTLSINFTSNMEYLNIFVMDSDGASIKLSDKEAKSGRYYNDNYGFKWNEELEVCNASAKYSVKKGTYYIRFKRCSITKTVKGSGDLKFSVSYPGESNEKVSDSSAKDCITIYLDKGDTLQLGALFGGKENSSIKWSSSDKKVAKVSSKGVVKAAAEGKTVITAKSGKKSVSIVVIVED